jgi:hypothetical protein
MAEATRDCSTLQFHDTATVRGGELRVWRCDWGWKVEYEGAIARSRFLDEAMQEVLVDLDREGSRTLVELLNRELSAERDANGRTAYRSIRRDAVSV